jgi:ATP-dependent Lhr-like helicase
MPAGNDRREDPSGLPFHPLINAWFTKTYGSPTAIQAAAWPRIKEGRHVLALAPTGSGKTLTAFLSALSCFCEGSYDAEETAVLYVSPLKALNEDIRRNLLEPLGALRARFEEAGRVFPPVTVETRSGDTSQADRRRFYRKPPSILVTTPESLGILLLNPRGREILSTLRCLILDEIHSVLGTKRGSYLACQVDRLALVAAEVHTAETHTAERRGNGEFQRIGLSATVNPPKAAAEFLGGLRNNGGIWEQRPVDIAAPPWEKRVDFTVEGMGSAEGMGTEPPANGLSQSTLFAAERIIHRIEANRGTLVFTGSRREAERLSYAINRGAGRPLSFVHHGSLAKELRRAVEQALAEGKIPCVVATSSLELGIDIGSADEVILAGAPSSTSSALQRIGRSGHGVGKTSLGRFIPLKVSDLLPAAALALGIREREIEETRPIENPLDVLAQIILALVAEKDRDTGELYALLRGFYVFRTLSRADYEGVIAMLAGYGEGDLRLRELKPRLYRDRVEGSLAAAPGVQALLLSSGGVIPSRGLYAMRPAGGKGKLGELDEEFVWERRIGDRFNLGNRSWRIVSIGDEAVEVAPAEFDSGNIPFWRAEPLFRSAPLSRRILEILDRFKARGELGAEALPEFSAAALERLNRYLGSQKRAQGEVPLPGTDFMSCEILRGDGARGHGMIRVLIHNFRGGAINYPFALAVAGELEDRYGGRVESFSGNDTVLFLLPNLDEQAPEDIEKTLSAVLLSLNRGGGLSRGERQFRRRLESSSRFGAAFREAAERSLTLPKTGFGRRSPLWIIRQRSKRLFDAVISGSRTGEPPRDFPLVTEAWRSCLRDEFDMEGFRDLIGALENGTLGFSFFHSPAGSPFAAGIVWQETNSLLYEGDGRGDPRRPGGRYVPGPLFDGSLSGRIIAEALDDPALRPVIPAELAADFTARLRRELPGWAPEDARSLAEWVKERIAIPLDEWETLLRALPSPVLEELRGDPGLGGRLRVLKRAGAAVESVVHREWEKTWLGEGPVPFDQGLSQGFLQGLCQWLRFQGPVSLSRIGEVFGLEAAALEGMIRTRGDGGDRDLIYPVNAGAGEDLVCDAENLELLLRLKRARARPEIKERPASLLVPFLAIRQGLAGNDGPLGDWAAGLELPAGLWETEILSSRRDDYRPDDLEEELREGRLLWYGAGKGRTGFCRPEDLDLVLPAETGGETETGGEAETSGKTETGGKAGQDSGGGTGSEKPVPPFDRPDFFDVPRTYWEIKDAAGLGDRALIPAIWEQVWKGRLSSDSWEAPRRGAWNTGKTGDVLHAEPPAGLRPFTHRRIPRATRAVRDAVRDRRERNAPLPGRWFSLGRESAPEDPLDQDELDRDRVRLLLSRWGVLCRPLLERESPVLSWARLLPTIRRMELAGELAAGRFFSGIGSLQFASPGILRDLEEAEEFADRGGAFYRINAADPASPAALDIEGLDPRLPARSPRNRLYYRGRELAAVSLRNGKEIKIFIPPERCAALAALIKAPRTRKPNPEKKLLIETINGAAAAESPYGPCFTQAGFIPDRGKLYLW